MTDLILDIPEGPDEEQTDETEPIIKPKRQVSQHQLEHLEKIRIRAAERKKEMREITDKANKVKEIESLKSYKQQQKQKLAEEYDRLMKVQETEKPMIVEKQVEKQDEKKKKVKKIIYETSSDEDNEETEIVVKRVNKKKIVTPPPPIADKSYADMVYESSLDKIKQKIMDDRCRHLLNSVLPQYN